MSDDAAALLAMIDDELMALEDGDFELPTTSLDETPSFEERRIDAARRQAGIDPYDRETLEKSEGQIEQAVFDLTGLSRAGTAIRKAIRQPSVGSVANAVAQTALLPAPRIFRPMTAAGALGVGYANALMTDMGAYEMGAQAAMPGGIPTNPPLPVRRPSAKDMALREALSDATAQRAHERALEQDRLREETSLRLLLEQRRIDAEAEAAKKEEETRRYNAQVAYAEQVRDKALAKRGKRFSETAVGKFYEDTAGITPFLAAFGAGALHRLGSGPATTAMGKYGWPFIEGGAAALAANSAPLVHNAFNLPSANPEREAYLAYARELPPTHPRKQEFLKYAQEVLPEQNPESAQAFNRLVDPAALAGRIGVSAIEGLSGPLGATVGNIPRRIGTALHDMPALTKGSVLSPPRVLKNRSGKVLSEPRRAAPSENVQSTSPVSQAKGPGSQPRNPRQDLALPQNTRRRSSASKPTYFRQSHKDKVKEAIFQAAEKRGSHDYVTVDDVMAVVPKGVPRASVEQYVDEIKKALTVLNPSRGSDSAEKLRKIRNAGVKFALPVAATGSAIGGASNMDY